MNLQNAHLTVAVGSDGTVTISSAASEFLCIGPLTASVAANGSKLCVARRDASQVSETALSIATRFDSSDLRLIQRWEKVDDTTVRLRSELRNDSQQPVELNGVSLLQTDGVRGSKVLLAAGPSKLRLYEQGNHWARSRRPGAKASGGGPEEDPTQQVGVEGNSRICWLSYDSDAPLAFAVGFETQRRWNGHVQTREDAAGTLSQWSVGFDGGDVAIDSGESLELEDVLLMAGREPWALLEYYADLLALQHHVQVLPASPVSWCSWYPYRLGVTEERTLDTARIAARRLKPLGLEIIVLDLGWERDFSPSSFEENDQFSHGLLWLSKQLEELGFVLGAWNGPTCINEHDEVGRLHPDWLLGGQDESGRLCAPLPIGKWTWEPFGATYGLDLTHPQAQEWLRENIRSLFERGVKYIKLDFFDVNNDSRLRERHDRRMVAGGGIEMSRIAMRIIMEEFGSKPGAIALNCGAPELPHPDMFPIIYACFDTGNTNSVGWPYMRENFGSNVAGHLWKQGRWGIIQPSCLCVGLPGTIDEARLRATVAFLSGGQIDIGDDLTTLPEERWQILEATLPPLGKPARPIDYFDPIEKSSFGGEVQASEVSHVWHLPVETSWDRWHLIGVFNYDVAERVAKGVGSETAKFQLPLKRFGLSAEETYWAYEFWSGQFLGSIPTTRSNPRGYTHVGDVAGLVATSAPGIVEVTFFGPAVKLIVLRQAKPHPWVVGTSFHQSNGAELEDVEWQSNNEGGGVLRGVLRRPAGQSGTIAIADCGLHASEIRVNDESVTARSGANGAVILPITTRTPITPWEIHWRPR